MFGTLGDRGRSGRTGETTLKTPMCWWARCTKHSSFTSQFWCLLMLTRRTMALFQIYVIDSADRKRFEETGQVCTVCLGWWQHALCMSHGVYCRDNDYFRYLFIDYFSINRWIIWCTKRPKIVKNVCHIFSDSSNFLFCLTLKNMKNRKYSPLRSRKQWFLCCFTNFQVLGLVKCKTFRSLIAHHEWDGCWMFSLKHCVNIDFYMFLLHNWIISTQMPFVLILYIQSYSVQHSEICSLQTTEPPCGACRCLCHFCYGSRILAGQNQSRKNQVFVSVSFITWVQVSSLKSAAQLFINMKHWSLFFFYVCVCMYN